MRAWHAAHPQGQHGGHDYSAERFGLSEGEMAERFGATDQLMVYRDGRLVRPEEKEEIDKVPEPAPDTTSPTS